MRGGGGGATERASAGVAWHGARLLAESSVGALAGGFGAGGAAGASRDGLMEVWNNQMLPSD